MIRCAGMLPITAAEAAVAQALADAERYYRLVLKAIRNAKSN